MATPIQHSSTPPHPITTTRVKLRASKSENDRAASEHLHFNQYEGPFPPYSALVIGKVKPGDIYIQNTPSFIQVFMVGYENCSPSGLNPSPYKNKTWIPWLLEKHGYKARFLKHPNRNDRYLWFHATRGQFTYLAADSLSRNNLIDMGEPQDVMQRLREIFPRCTKDDSHQGSLPAEIVLDLPGESELSVGLGIVENSERCGEEKVNSLNRLDLAQYIDSEDKDQLRKALLQVREEHQSLLRELKEQGDESRKLQLEWDNLIRLKATALAECDD